MVKKQTYIFSDERKNNDLTALAQTLKPFVQTAAKTGRLAETLLNENWESLVGETAASFSCPGKIFLQKGEKTDGILQVFAANGAFALELSHRERYIVEKINTFLGYNAVATLKIMQNADKIFLPPREYPAEKMKKMLVTKKEETYITDLSAGVENENLREALIKLGISVFNDNKEE